MREDHLKKIIAGQLAYDSFYEALFDLQRFAAEDEGRTEDPTSKKIEKAREEGQVAKSIEIPQALTILAALSALYWTFPRILKIFHNYFTHILSNLSEIDVSQGSVGLIITQAVVLLFSVSWPAMVAAVAVAIFGNYLQVGLLFTLKPLKPKWNKIAPTPKKIAERFFPSKMIMFNFAKSVFKVAVMGIIGYMVLRDNFLTLITTSDMGYTNAVMFVAAVAYEFIVKASIFLLIIALFDYLFQRYQWKESIKMKKQEVKDEMKQAEGDPQVKAEIRRRMREVMRRRMMQEVPHADVVITNPTHYAIAVRYDAAVMRAPQVMAKGEGFLALRIIEIARDNDVPTVENRPLAQALYRSCEVGDEVPPELYHAVAEVLAFVYRLKNQGGSAAGMGR